MSDEATPDPEVRVAELRAKRVALQAARAAGEAERATARALAYEEQALLDEEALQKLIDEHGDVGVALSTVQTSMGLIVLKKASSIRFRRFQDKDKPTAEDVLQLVSPCVVHPTPAQFSVILNELPALLMRLASEVISLCGQSGEDLVKK